MKVIILTNKNKIVENILNEFSLNDIKIDAIVIEEQISKSITAKIKKISPVFLINILRKIRGFEKVKYCESVRSYYRFSKKVFVVDNFNSHKTENILNELKPSLIILGGSRILKEHIINIPKIGILNAHPGILPKYRGVHVLLWSIYNDDPIGVTVHFIDSGIDTGRICEQEVMQIRKGETLEELRTRANVISGKLMASVVKKILNNKSEPTKINPIGEGKQYYRMDAESIKIVRQKLKKL